MKKVTVYLTLILVITALPVFALDLSNVKDGDIIFQNSPSRQSKAIQLATHSKFTHVGIIFYKDTVPYVLEAVQPVCYTKLGQWIDHVVDDYFVIMRLQDSDSLLNSETVRKMITEGEKFLSKDYDIYFDWSDEELYCSELVWKVYKRGAGIELSKLKKLKEYDLSHLEVKKVMQRRYGDNPPLESHMVSPQDIFESEYLNSVYELTDQ